MFLPMLIEVSWAQLRKVPSSMRVKLSGRVIEVMADPAKAPRVNEVI